MVLLKLFIYLSFLITISFSSNISNKVFKEYCWGCHHETSTAFGPSFKEIANKRTEGEIKGHIVAPKSTYKNLGYKRSVMPSFGNVLSDEELNSVTKYIQSYKNTKVK